MPRSYMTSNSMSAGCNALPRFLVLCTSGCIALLFAQERHPRHHTALYPSASLHILLIAYAMIRVLMGTHAPPQAGEVVHGLLHPPRSGRRSPAPASAGDVSGTPAPVSAG